MEEAAKEQTSASASARRSSSRLLRYPLRSAGKMKEEKAPLADSSNSSAPRRGKPAPSVSKSVGVLDLNGKDKPAKPPRRMSVPSKSIASPASRQVGNITPIAEARSRRSIRNEGKSDTPLSDVSKSLTKRKFNVIFSASYWLNQIKLSESSAKHSISLGFFKLGLEAGCEPLQRMRDELKAYTQRHNLVELGEPLKQLFESYNILPDFEQLQVSETCSHVPEEGTRSSDDEIHSSSSVADFEKVVPKPPTKETAAETGQAKESTRNTTVKSDTAATKTNRSEKKVAAVSGTRGRNTQKKQQKPIKNNNDKVKSQGKKSANEGLIDAPPPEKVLEENKENSDALQTEALSCTDE
ncbi:PREDICTED: uncharacterized protein LOC109191897 isoform X2 [Ipomoea nil]|uniref:uncharacterized protein LOC109191897 isoform X2 n=1 Tax=Ipomoea nil TaxID=35883 RepID=UPI000901EA0F|nr:PREDICTED: uncharacterized protein LOC109191897 isoform X2 [Ipomoea nil]